ncbi:hypothetical protein [Vagococcus fluvialis]|uniref:hypothetical protein n=1 Tax=Vagococcus fluvialis TaxID=2738 RepID=UPI001D0BE3DA|nr:hypothetical protein [Vagococcus fluvialis]UDM79870.1 hypothetical protein K5K97_00445 [Vagococcus fluvialis]
MEFKEKEFGKMVRKARLKQSGRIVGITLLLIVLITLISGGVFLNHYNYIDVGNKDNPKVKGLPNNTIKALDQRDGFLGLLFDFSGGFEMNGVAKEMTVYLDYYEKGTLKEKVEVLSVLPSEENKELNGTFYWGLSETNKKLSTSFSTTGGVSMNSGYDLTSFDLEGWQGGIAADSLEKGFDKSEKYLLYKLVYNEKNATSFFSDSKEEFKPKNIEKNDKLLLFYATFK